MALPLLDKIADILGGSFVGKILDKFPDAGEKAKLAEELEKEKNRAAEALVTLFNEENKIANEAVTERWKADMASDSKLAKNVRPLTLLYLLALITILIILDSWNPWGFAVKVAWVELIQMLLMLVFGAYFAGRSYEKGKEISSKSNGTGK